MNMISPSWDPHLAGEFSRPYMQQLLAFLNRQESSMIYPPEELRYTAFRHTPFDQVKVIILGQDPYHGPGQAHGLSFSVPPGIKIPPSLRNVYRELQDDLGIPAASHGHLISWASQGILLLNTTLTVTAGKAASHQNRGWEQFTDQAIRSLNQHREHLVFMLWGSASQAKGGTIDTSRHLILNAPHPSPLSAYRGFFGCRHFSKANRWLQAHHMEPINWQLPDIGQQHFQQTFSFS